MTSEQEHRRTELRKHLENAFPPEYWEEFSKEFGHNFFNAHIDRTLEYDTVLNEKISHKTVLEVGSFPGLELAWLLNCQCRVTPLDSPNYRPKYYLDWVESKDLASFEHDIVTGEWGIELDGRWDVCIMSDVLLHIEGFPSDFMSYIIKNCEDIYLINYPGDSQIVEAKGHNLKQGHASIPSDEALRVFMEASGATFVETIVLESGNRHLNIFKGNLD